MKHLMVVLVLLASAMAQAQNRDICSGVAKFHVKAQDAAAEEPLAPGKSRLYVVREGIGFFNVGVALDGRWVGATKKDTHFAITLDPGEYRLCAAGALGRARLDPGFFRLKAEAGQTYYVEQVIDSMIGAHDRVRLVLINEEEGRALVERTRTAVLTDPAP